VNGARVRTVRPGSALGFILSSSYYSGFAGAYVRRMRCESYLTSSSLATWIRQSVSDSEWLSINELQLWCMPLVDQGNPSALLAHVRGLATLAMDPTLIRISRVASILVPLIASASLIWHGTVSKA
jgi:hypothetical protein